MFVQKAVFILALTWATSVAAQPAQDALQSMRPVKVNRGLPPQLDSELQQMLDSQAAASGARAPAAAALSLVEAVPVSIRFEGSPDSIETALASLAIQPLNRADRVVEAYVPVSLLSQVASLGTIERVTLIQSPRSHAMSQGASVHNATSWQMGGFNAAGVKVGVIDLGFLGLTTLLGTELPASVTARCYTGIGAYTTTPFTCDTGTPHGAAVAEALLDVAPGVELYIANPQSPLDLRGTVDWMTSLGVRIINHSLGWTWTGPGDGTSPYADAPLRSVDAAVAGGAVWVQAAGNDALGTWTGSTSDVDGDGWQEFQPLGQCPEFGGCEINAVALRVGTSFVAQMRWDDSWIAATRDLDLYLVEWNPSIGVLTPVAVSANLQAGATGQVPLETLVYSPPFDCACSYFLSFSRLAGTAPAWVQVQSFTGEPLQYATLERSISNPAETANPGALAVGAAPWFEPETLEPFSSRGPTRDGRDKPDLVGADRGESTSFGAIGFIGTSQAAPHVAGLAALVLGSFPDTPPLQLTMYLKDQAARRVPRRQWGAGFAQLPVLTDTVNVSALLSDTPSPAERKQSITWRAFAIGANGPFEYAFWVQREGRGWTKGRAYGASNVFVWSPHAAGTYTVLVYARRIGSRHPFEAARRSEPFVVNRARPPMLTLVEPDPPFPREVGSSITWTATGGVAPLEYEFWLLRHGFGVSAVQGYGPSDRYTWTPAAGDAGIYTLVVLARSTGSAASLEAWDVFGPFRIP
jgi:subtilisin family serine protease